MALFNFSPELAILKPNDFVQLFLGISNTKAEWLCFGLLFQTRLFDFFFQK